MCWWLEWRFDDKLSRKIVRCFSGVRDVYKKKFGDRGFEVEIDIDVGD